MPFANGSTEKAEVPDKPRSPLRLLPPPDESLPPAAADDAFLDIPAFLRRGNPACPIKPRGGMGGITRETLRGRAP